MKTEIKRIENLIKSVSKKIPYIEDYGEQLQVMEFRRELQAKLAILNCAARTTKKINPYGFTH